MTKNELAIALSWLLKSNKPEIFVNDCRVAFYTDNLLIASRPLWQIVLSLSDDASGDGMRWVELDTCDSDNPEDWKESYWTWNQITKIELTSK
jgi:hypothetical protein